MARITRHIIYTFRVQVPDVHEAISKIRVALKSQDCLVPRSSAQAGWHEHIFDTKPEDGSFSEKVILDRLYKFYDINRMPLLEVIPNYSEKLLILKGAGVPLALVALGIPPTLLRERLIDYDRNNEGLNVFDSNLDHLLTYFSIASRD